MGGVVVLGEALADRYTIEHEVGHGAMATVYLARDLRYNREVALKVMNPELSAALGPERFLREIDVVAHLNHPHILPLLDSGDAGGALFYAMPYVEGESLRHRLNRESRLRIDDAFALVREVALALDYAHEQGIVHRDVKPENILLSRGFALLADFGIAHVVSQIANVEPLTQTGVYPGTPAYMSPEQCGGGGPLDGRSDLYALACVLYEMLAGEPPFTGRTAQAIVARHLQEPPPSLRVVRPTVTLAVQEVIETALAKVPADRYSTAAQFVSALEGARTGRMTLRRRLLQTLTIAVTAVAAGILWLFVIGPNQPLDLNRVVVYPLAESPPGSSREGTGEAVALMIGTGLEHTEPLRWIDGWTLLDPRQRENLALLTNAAERRIARNRGARWYLDGSVVRQGDSATVVLRLTDAGADSLIGRASASGLAPHAAQVGLQAVNALLPRLLAPGRRIDLSALSARKPAAVASWLQGEREYRRSDFDRALDYLRRAVNEDSSLAVAALRGLQAASWRSSVTEAETFAAVVVRHLALLPRRQAYLARGLDAYLRGQADSSITWLNLALADAPDWTEAHMARAEVYYHLLPTATGPLDSLAKVELTSAAVDTGFAPPRFHLAEIAIRSGDHRQSELAVRQFVSYHPDPQSGGQLTLMLDCLQSGRGAVPWDRAARDGALDALRAAKALAVAGAFPGCAEDGFRAILANQAASGYHWGAFLGLQGVLAAEGRVSELRTLIDSLVGTGMEAASRLYLLDAMGGIAVAKEAGQVADRYSHDVDPKSPQTEWLLASWYAYRGDVAEVESAWARLNAAARTSSDPVTDRLAQALGGRLALLRGDTSEAIRRFRAILPSARREALEWDLSEPLAGERLLLAELLLARGFTAEASVVASQFDHPSPAAFLPFLPASLAIRYRTALALGQRGAGARFRERLRTLGHGDLLAVRSLPQ